MNNTGVEIGGNDLKKKSVNIRIEILLFYLNSVMKSVVIAEICQEELCVSWIFSSYHWLQGQEEKFQFLSMILKMSKSLYQPIRHAYM